MIESNEVKIQDIENILNQPINENERIKQMQPCPKQNLKFKDIYLANVPPFSQSAEEQLTEAQVNKLYRSGIYFFKTFKLSKFKIIIGDFLPNKQIISAKVYIQNFVVSIHILNVFQEIKNHEIKECFSGSFATTYKANIDKRSIAIKCHSFKGDSRSKTFKNVIKEYCLYRIASVLQAAPFLEKPLGFDIIIYKNCIQFTMQFCEQGFTCNKSIKEDLISNLRAIHRLKLVHLDIKPDNICYSPTFKKYVFIDFGLGKVIQQGVDKSTPTYFGGSLEFCSPQMKECYLTNSQRHINLYYNDYICLKNSFLHIKQIIENQQFEQHIQKMFGNIQNNFDFFEMNILTICKYNLNFNLSEIHFNALLGIFKKYAKVILQKYEKNIKEFLQNLEWNPNTSIFYQRYIKSNKKQQVREHIFQFRLQNLYAKQKTQKNNQQDLFFKKQYQVLINTNKETQEYLWSAQMQSQLILNDYKAAKHKKEEYFLVMANVLQITCTNHQHQTKMHACRIMRKVYPMEFTVNNNQQIEILQGCIQFLFNYGFSVPTTRIKIEIISKMIASIIILECKSETQLIAYFQSALELQSPVTDKIQRTFKLYCITSQDMSQLYKKQIKQINNKINKYQFCLQTVLISTSNKQQQ